MATIRDGIVHSPYPSVDIPVCSFYCLATEKLQCNDDKKVLVDESVSLTRAEVLRRMRRFAVGFQSHGVRPGDRVCVHLSNAADNLIASYACVLAGATIVMAKASLTQDELSYLAADSDCTHILTDIEFAEKATRAVSTLNMKGMFSMSTAAGFASVAEFLELDERTFTEVPVDDPRETVFAVSYTSGSTGLPKGAELTHYNFVARFYTSRVYVPWGASDVFLCLSPIMHSTGLVTSMQAVLDGLTCVVTPFTSSPLQIINAVEKYQATLTLMFPSQLQAIVREMKLAGRNLPTMRNIIVAGSVLAQPIANAAHETFANVSNLVNMYGMTETCGGVTGRTTPHNAETATDAGVLRPMVMLKVADLRTRKRLGPHEVGEICIMCDTMIKGYYKRPNDSADLFDEDGWLKSGDLGYYDEDGKLYITDRMKHMIKCMDTQVTPSEIEEVLLKNHAEDVADVSVVGIPHVEYGEVPAAAVVPTAHGRRRDHLQLAEEMKSTVAGKLAVYKHLHGGVFFMNSLPRTETGKVDKAAVALSISQA